MIKIPFSIESLKPGLFLIALFYRIKTQPQAHMLGGALRGRDVILEGSRWQVGNGKSIQVWQHYWLPIKHPTVIESPMLESMGEATMVFLINAETRSWELGHKHGWWHFHPTGGFDNQKNPFKPFGIWGLDCLGNVEGWEVHMQVRIHIFEGEIKVG